MMLRAGIPVLETERLVLSPLGVEDSNGMFELWRDPGVCEFSGSAVDSQGRVIALPATSRADSDRLLEYWLDRARSGSGFRWAVHRRVGEAFLGAIGFNSLGPDAELAYHFVSVYWGCGFATEASREAIYWAFSRGASSITCNIEPANLRSAKLACALGFEAASEVVAGAQTYRLLRDVLPRND